MNKHVIRIAIAAAIVAVSLASCDLFKLKKENTCTFTVNDGVRTQSSEWGKDAEEIGFLRPDYGYFFSIFSGDDRAEDDDSVEGTFSARLRTLEGDYRTLEGSFKTFDSSDSRRLEIDPSLRLDIANCRNRTSEIRAVR